MIDEKKYKLWLYMVTGVTCVLVVSSWSILPVGIYLFNQTPSNNSTVGCCVQKSVRGTNFYLVGFGNEMQHYWYVIDIITNSVISYSEYTYINQGLIKVRGWMG